MVTRREAELAKLARDIVACVSNGGKPWDECDQADLIDCLEAFTVHARQALAIKAKPTRRRAVLSVTGAGAVFLDWKDRGVSITVKDDATRRVIHKWERR